MLEIIVGLKLTLSLLDASCVNAQSYLRILNESFFWEHIIFVKLIEHILPTILHDLFEAIAGEPEL
mgnify:CR=1 FL=1